MAQRQQDILGGGKELDALLSQLVLRRFGKPVPKDDDFIDVRFREKVLGSLDSIGPHAIVVVRGRGDDLHHDGVIGGGMRHLDIDGRRGLGDLFDAVATKGYEGFSFLQKLAVFFHV
jgi:hypothetical protein